MEPTCTVGSERPVAPCRSLLRRPAGDRSFHRIRGVATRGASGLRPEGLVQHQLLRPTIFVGRPTEAGKRLQTERLVTAVAGADFVAALICEPIDQSLLLRPRSGSARVRSGKPSGNADETVEVVDKGDPVPGGDAGLLGYPDVSEVELDPSALVGAQERDGSAGDFCVVLVELGDVGRRAVGRVHWSLPRTGGRSREGVCADEDRIASTTVLLAEGSVQKQEPERVVDAYGRYTSRGRKPVRSAITRRTAVTALSTAESGMEPGKEV